MARTGKSDWISVIPAAAKDRVVARAGRGGETATTAGSCVRGFDGLRLLLLLLREDPACGATGTAQLLVNLARRRVVLHVLFAGFEF